MLGIIKSLMLQALDIVQGNSGWMGWNLFLAFIPLGLSILLFREVAVPPRRGRLLSGQSPSALFWFGGLAFIAFLFSLSFTSGDFIHLLQAIHRHRIIWVIPMFTVAIVEVLALFQLSNAPLQTRSRSPFWWVGVLTFVAFLPNAPYVLTDIIHLVQDIRVQGSIWLITLVVIPLYLVFIVAGFEAYVLALINLGYYLRQQGLGHFVLAAEVLLHALSSLGIYLGRFLRFNSWDVVTRFDTLATSLVEDVLGRDPLLIMIVTFVLIMGLYWLMRRVTLAIATYHEPSKSNSLGV